MFTSILVVCAGNICRSPLGEQMLKKNLPSLKVSSAGVIAMDARPADSMAKRLAEENGLSLQNHKSQQLTGRLCRECDLILAMERKHIEDICRIYPAGRGKIMLFGHWNNKLEIPDPYHKSLEAYEYVFKLLLNSSIGWVAALTSHEKKSRV